MVARSNFARSIIARSTVATAMGLCGAVACSTTTQTTTVSGDGQGGAGGTTGASTEDTSGGTAAGGVVNAGCSAALQPDLHAACIEDLGQGVFRFHYDFTTADQALDWAPSTGTTQMVNQKALVITAAPDEIGVAIFKKKLHTSKLSFSVTLLSGKTTNWYINTIWSGYWNPDSAYAGYHDYSGRGFVINGEQINPDDVSPLSVGVMQNVVIEQTDSELKWEQGGVTITHAVAPVPVNDRILAIGAWDASAAFYNVVIEGTLN
jgi:hypothetical protein